MIIIIIVIIIIAIIIIIIIVSIVIIVSIIIITIVIMIPTNSTNRITIALIRLIKTFQATTPASLSEAGRCLTQSATASASKVEILPFSLSPPQNAPLADFEQTPVTNCIAVPPKPPTIRVHRVTSNSISLR